MMQILKIVLRISLYFTMVHRSYSWGSLEICTNQTECHGLNTYCNGTLCLCLEGYEHRGTSQDCWAVSNLSSVPVLLAVLILTITLLTVSISFRIYYQRRRRLRFPDRLLHLNMSAAVETSSTIPPDNALVIYPNFNPNTVLFEQVRTNNNDHQAQFPTAIYYDPPPRYSI